MILDLPGYDRITNKITFGLIQCFYEENNETPNKSAFQVSYRKSLSQGKQPVVCYMRVLTVHSDW